MDTVKATLVDAMHFDIEVDGHHFMVDAASEVGGIDAGPQPVRLLIAGLAGCTGMDVISILRKKRQEVTHFEVEVNGARATDYPKVYTDIEVVYRVRGHNIDQASFERAIQLSEERYCPAMAMLRKAANITNRYEIEQEY
ncbi:MAG: OsmC family protein [Anaerolineae bacterium]|uniref:OsmC family protein n=1 Tax=Candidatus Amarolinea dominans TaxID=3140696 RepID=UPI001E16B70A|nr:OsmC family protein [Anaerolineae bacterium]MBK7199042.1 OsmC family protein [Anaerolineae bacterium]MBK9095786.1 OsmC family protein [Anaerolineae bacterium]MBK9230211.1 OsmC family protein [Anaerolineae bacterium]